MKNEIKKRLGEGFEVIELTVPKNNGIIKHGFAIQRTGENIGCTIYIDDVPEEEAVDYVISEFERWKDNIPEEMKNAKRVMEPDFVLANVFPILLNKELNKDRMERLAHRDYLDLAIAYRIQIAEGSTALVENRLLEVLHLTEEDLYKNAIKNIDDYVEIFKVSNEVPMLILSRKDKTWGGGAILSATTLALINDIYEGDSYFLIAPSVDEWVIMPFWDKDIETDLKRMLTETVNNVSKKVDSEDFLSKSIYVCRNGKIEVA